MLPGLPISNCAGSCKIWCQGVPRWAQETWHKKYSLSVCISFKTGPIWALSQTVRVLPHPHCRFYSYFSIFVQFFRMRPLNFCQHTIHQVIWPSPDTLGETGFHPKTLPEMTMALSLNSDSFPSNSHVSAIFSFWIHSKKFWNLGISNKLWNVQCWRNWRILINLCGNMNVWNCDLLQRDFFGLYRTVLGVAKAFFWSV